MFKGFKPTDLLGTKDTALIAILAEELARTNTALEAMNEEMRQIKSKANRQVTMLTQKL